MDFRAPFSKAATNLELLSSEAFGGAPLSIPGESLAERANGGSTRNLPGTCLVER